ncbi:MAG: hypothetical protein PHP62_01775 [Candidatus Moranbacteria bacterium]|nr:hypothetical protein [Candidatus Moranbacteria bacterium]
MKKMAILFAALAALVTLSGVAFANNIHDGTGGAILTAHQTAYLSVATQPAIATIISPLGVVAIVSNADTPFRTVAPITMAAITVEVIYEPKFPNLVLPIISHEWTIVQYAAISEVQNTASLVSYTA